MRTLGKVENITMLGKRILATKLADLEECVQDGIVIPDSVVKRDPVENGLPGMKMRLVAKSADCQKEARDLQPGDKLYIRPYAFEQIRCDEGLYYIILEEDIRCKLS